MTFFRAFFVFEFTPRSHIKLRAERFQIFQRHFIQIAFYHFYRQALFAKINLRSSASFTALGSPARLLAAIVFLTGASLKSLFDVAQDRTDLDLSLSLYLNILLVFLYQLNELLLHLSVFYSSCTFMLVFIACW